MILEVKGLTKHYQSFRKEPGVLGGIKALVSRQVLLIPAVSNLNFQIQKGEFVGLLGPNGAGKTTTLKMLTGLIGPTEGKAIAFGCYDTGRRPSDYLRKIGLVMGQRSQLHPDLPAIDSFRLSKAIYALSEERFEKRLRECLDLFAIEAKINIPVRKLSLGERMKMELIFSILHEPELLFLDEPTIGLDFHAAHQIRDFLKQVNKDLGITVILTSHYSKDIEQLCKRVILINHGRIVYDGPLSGVDERIQDQRTLSLTFHEEQAAQKAEKVFTSHGYSVLDHDFEAKELRVLAARRQVAQAIALAITHVGADAIFDLKVNERGIDEVFAEVYRRAP